jgi:peptidoglycan hydrolase-like protein with peptidoglycan-binding domain
MHLVSRHFRNDKRLQDCLVKDSAHVTKDAKGEHVAKIQRALIAIEGPFLDPAELRDKHYGASTVSAVLAYKRKRQIINRTYQSKPDGIVGKMTIASLDADMARLEMRTFATNSCAGIRLS